jgi:hypothetical protein
MRNDEQRQDLRIRAYELRLAGNSWRQIGSALGIGHETARRWVKEHLDATELPLVDEIRKTEVDRLLRYLERLDIRIDEGDDKAISLAIKISERLCKMLGADMPVVSITETHTVSELDLDIRRLIEAQNAQNAAAREKAANKGIAND